MLERAGKLGGPPGLTINAVSPGVTATEMVATIPEKIAQRVISGIPLRRMADPDEIARVVHFLAADESAYITGQVWAVNGGMDM